MVGYKLEINSKKYWDFRFNTDWVANYGRQQSEFFSKIAEEAFPEWLVSLIENNQPVICDWGCALGDGTQYLHKRFPGSPIKGIDFSEVAIDTAKETYPEIDFICRDLLIKTGNKEFDIIFSSNTLEHFSNPWSVLSKLSSYAGQHLILLIPYKEKDRYSEHRYTFTENNIPSSVNESFFLTHAEIINGADYTPNYWGQLQVLLVYSHAGEAGEHRLKRISSAEMRIIESLHQQKWVLNSLKEMKKELKEQLAAMRADLENKTRELQNNLQEKDELILAQRNLLEVRQLMAIQLTLEQRLLERENTINDLRKDIETATGLKSEKDMLDERLKEKESLVIRQEEKILEFGQACKTQSEEKDMLKERLMEKESMIAHLEEKLLESGQLYKTQLEQKDTQIGILQNKIEDARNLESQNTELNECLTKKEAEMRRLKEELDTTRVQSAEKDKYTGEMKKALQKANDQLTHKNLLEQKLEKNEKYIGELKKEIGKANVQIGIKTLLEDQLAEREKLIDSLQKELEKQNHSTQEIAQSKSELEIYVNRLGKDVEWYKATFEDRSMLGVFKQKIRRNLFKK